MVSSLDQFSFDCTGVAIVRKAIDDSTLQRAITAVDSNWPAGTPWKFPVLHLDRVFWELLTHPYLLKFSTVFAGDHFRLDHAFGVSANGSHKQLHGGPYSSQHSCFYMNTPINMRKALVGQLNFGFALRGQDKETGGFCFIPGSHKANESKDGKEVFLHIYDKNLDHHSVEVPTLNPGDLLIFSESLVHGDTGRLTQSAEPRTQIYYKITPGWMCWRDPRQNEHLLSYAENDLERRLIEPPWTGQYSEDNVSMGFNNVRRPITVK